MSQTYFTSDNHFDHARVIPYCKRPFADVDEMNAEMVRRWNERVRPEDTVFHLGDFHMGPKERIRHWVEQLNGYKILVLGNHDRSPTVMRDAGFDFTYKSLIHMARGFDVLLAHKPDLSQNEAMAQGLGVTMTQRYMFCGHVHETWKRQGNVINVGVDQWNFTPVTLEELINA